MAISLEYGFQKFILISFSILVLFFGLYPYLIPIMPGIKFIEPTVTSYIIAALGLLQLIYILRLKKPPIYRAL